MTTMALKWQIYAGLIFLAATSAHATCTNPKNWLDAPGNDTKVFLDYRPIGRGQGYFNESPIVGYIAPYPEPLEKAMRDEQQQVNLPADGAKLTYYEPDGKGEWRICREDQWGINRTGDTNTTSKSVLLITERYKSSHKNSRILPADYTLRYSKQYFYDAKGRRKKETEWFHEDQTAHPIDIQCYRYDEKGRVILSLHPQTTKFCTEGEPDLRDSWTRYKFGEYKYQPVILLKESHLGQEDGTWEKDFFHVNAAVAPNDGAGAAEANSHKGVTQIYGSNYGKLDDNAANTVLNVFNSWSGASYFFTKPPVPLAVLENPDLIYQYERRRRTYVDGQHITLFELFKANEHISRHRYYTLDGLLLRHEQLDEKGRVTRIITINDYRQPRPGPHPDVDDKQLSANAGITLTGHQIYHRVYELDAKGKYKLVAISWNRERYPLVGLIKFKKTSIEFADIVYGTPNGKEKWKTRDSFEKAFDHSWRATHVFPDLR